MTNGLPPGWVLATVGDVAHFVRGVTYSKEHAKKAPAPGLVGILRATNIGDGLDFDDLVFVPESFVSDEQIVRDGDVVLAMSSGSKSVVGKAAIARSPQRCGFGAFCGVIRPSQAITPSLLAHYFQTKAYRNAVSEVSKGSNINNLKAGNILERPLPLPPAGEQQRIASKIDELFSRIDEGERALERVSMLVERYRQSVLKAAVIGELTRAWREKNKDTQESGEALLARILTARREAWEKSELEKMKAKGITPANDKWKQKYQQPSPPDTTDLPELPNGWTWASLDQLTSKITSGSRDWKDYYGRGESVFVMAQNVRPRRLDFAEVQFVDPPPGDRDAERSEVRQHDLLVTIVGANTGDVCRVPTPLMRHYVCQSVALARPVLPTLSVFLELYLAADEGGQGQFTKVIYGAGRPHLSFDQLREIAIPLPSIAEQEAACSAVDLIESEIRAITSCLVAATRSSSALRQAALRSAFSGTLVRQHPADEPASALIERIAAERGVGTVAPKRGRRKKTTA